MADSSLARDPFRDPFSTPTAIDAIAKASAVVGDCHCSQFAAMLSATCKSVGIQSPIEAVFWAWWQAFEAVSAIHKPEVVPLALREQHEIVTCSAQLYRLDFSVYRYDTQECLKVAVELDGHDFHERTPEQVTRRDTRDRHLQADGWTVFHFSGREITRDPFACVSEVAIHCYRAIAKGNGGGEATR